MSGLVARSQGWAVSTQLPDFSGYIYFNNMDVSMVADFTHFRSKVKGVVNCQNSRDKGPPEGDSARG